MTRVLDQHLSEARIVYDIAANPILPPEIAELVTESHVHGWPRGVVTMHRLPR